MALRSIKNHKEAVRTLSNSSPLGRNRSQEHRVMYFVLEKLKELEEIIVGITKNPITITSDISIDDIRDAFKERHKDQEDEKPRIPKKMLDDQTMLFKDQERDERDERPAVVKELEKSESEMSAAELLKRMSGE